MLRIALAGNPNSGKTCIFNSLTGQRQHIGNYPGVTVEKKSGRIPYGDTIIEIVDLPGTYSLSAYSLEEIVSRDFVLHEKPDVIIDVMDSTNLERHLYLLLQFQELGVPVIGALNMSDEAREKGIEIDVEQLQRILGIPLVKTVGNRGIGSRELLETAMRLIHHEIPSGTRHLNYGPELEEAHYGIIQSLRRDPEFAQRYSLHWTAIKLLEKDGDAIRKIESEHAHPDDVLETATKIRSGIEKHFGEDSEIVVGEQRYGYIRGALKETLKHAPKENYLDITEKIDRLVLNRYLGIPIFLLVMFAIYQFTFALGNPASESISAFFNWSASQLQATMPTGPLLDFLTDGIIKGVGGVLVFLPLVVFLFLGLSFLEDTGYMARAAFVMDKFFHIFGLHGRSFIPFMVSTGCAVPGVMSARVLANPKDRIVTIMVAPFMMCGAKTPVIAMLAAAFFPQNAAVVFWSIWLLGWVSAFVTALIFRSAIFKGEQTPFVMELPPYRVPTLRGIFQHVWEKSWEYVKKAGTVILAASVIIWFALSFPRPKTAQNDEIDTQRIETEYTVSSADGAARTIENSIGGRLGHAIEPVLQWAGFDWKIGVSLVAGVAAKEVIISTLGILYGIEESPAETSVPESDLMVGDYLKRDPHYSPLMGLALMIFVILYVPCIATLAMVRKELGSWKWPLFQAVYTLSLALFLAILVFQIGSLLGLGV